jgi:hypothetical protein
VKIPWHDPGLIVPVNSSGCWIRRLGGGGSPIPCSWVKALNVFQSCIVIGNIPFYFAEAWRELSDPPCLIVCAYWVAAGSLGLAFQKALTGTANPANWTFTVNGSPVTLTALNWASSSPCLLVPAFTLPARAVGDELIFVYDGLDATLTWADGSPVPAMTLSVIFPGL